MAANLAITDNDTVIQYTSTGQSIFTFPFPFLANDEIKVSVDQADQVLGVDYNLSGLGDAGGGTVTFIVATTSGELISIWQAMPFKRLTGFATGAAVLAGDALNTEFVRQIRHDQQVRRDIRRALRLEIDDPISGQDMVIPTQATRAGKFLAFDAGGKPTVSAGSGGGDTSLRADLASQLAALGYNLVAITKSALEITAGATVVNAHLFPLDPQRYGAVGDGVADDSTEFAVAESVVGSISLNAGVDYNLGAIKPVNLVYGRGAVTLTGSASSPSVSGFEIGFDVAASSIVSVPEVWAETAIGEASPPDTILSYFNVILAPGSNANDTANNDVWRSVVIGEAAGEYITEWERVEAIGSGAMRFSEYAQRTTAIGSIALSWLGATSQANLAARFHDFWGAGGFDPGDASWDFAGLETDNPGIGATIDAFVAYATDTSGVSQNVAIGRDAGLHLVKGSSNTYIGYQAGAHAFNHIENTALGAFALKDSVFTEKSVAVGYAAGAECSEGLGNIFIGHESGENLVDGNRNVFIGGSSGMDYDLSGSNKYSNKFVMEMASLGHYLGGDINIANLFLNHGSDELADFEGEGSGYYNVVSPGTTPITPGRFLGTTTSGVAAFCSYAGSTSLRTHQVFEDTSGVVGSITTNSAVTAYLTSSDERLKVDLGEAEGALKRILATKVHRFHFKNDAEETEQIGVFSQELEKIFPRAVSGDADGMMAIGNIYNADGEIIRRDAQQPNSDKIRWEKTGEKIYPQQVDYSKLVAPLLAAVQEQQKQIDELRSEIAGLRK